MDDRSAKRISTLILVDYRSPSVSGAGQIWNLSRDGLCVAAKSLPRSGEEVTVTVLPTTRPISVTGVVQWTAAKCPDAPARFGMELREVPAEFREFVRGLGGPLFA